MHEDSCLNLGRIFGGREVSRMRDLTSLHHLGFFLNPKNIDWWPPLPNSTASSGLSTASRTDYQWFRHGNQSDSQPRDFSILVLVMRLSNLL
jgi:hypothetical protein